jgi:hypothetical protein
MKKVLGAQDLLMLGIGGVIGGGGHRASGHASLVAGLRVCGLGHRARGAGLGSQGSWCAG